ncbi:hypothetical protein [Bosea sp. BK604]|uniref:YncE family protein n=1 Tax=Bosea sp. BK604 TaxID=2512180 RepID=UPI001042C50E|nr:hypothetical protein [Bosea sp. BK604]TCR67377.1 hypothetical protein EV560_103437 [Bosea sp. BK604]
MRAATASLLATILTAAPGLGTARAQAPLPPGEYAYVALENAAQVAAIDLRNGSVAQRIAVGAGPRFTTASRDGTIVLSVNRTDDTISVIDTRLGKVVETLDSGLFLPPGGARMPDGTELGAGLGDVAASPDGQIVYANRGALGVVFFDRRSKVARYIDDNPKGSERFGTSGAFAISWDGQHIFMPTGTDLKVIDAGTRRIVSSIRQSGSIGPQGLLNFDISRDRNLIVHGIQPDIARMMASRGGQLATPISIKVVELPGLGTRQLSGISPGISQLNDPVVGVLLSHDGRRLYTARLFPQYRAFKPSTTPVQFAPKIYIDGHSMLNGASFGVTEFGAASSGLGLSEDGSRLIAIDPIASRVKILDAQTLRELHVAQPGPTPRAGRDFIVRVGAASSPPPATGSTPVPAATPASRPSLKF